MKQKLLKIFMLIFCLGLFLTGCATVSDVVDKSGSKITFDKPVYYQGQVAKVGDYLYYGNAYCDVADEEFNYNQAKKNSYMARVNLSNLSFKEDVLEQNYKNSTPNEVETVNSDKVVGYANQQMYAYGEYLYFTSANQYKTTTMLNDYSRVTLFRMKFNGDGLEELGTFTHDDKSIITLQQGSDKNYYFVVVCPTEAEETEEEKEVSTYDVYSIQVGNKVSKPTKLVGEVESAVVADENSTVKNVVYTYKTESERLPNAISSVDFATEKVTEIESGSSKSISLVARVGDVILYSYENEIYFKDATSLLSFTPADNTRFYSAPSISNVLMVKDGYLFKGTSALMYKSSLTSSAFLIAKSEDYSDILFADGDYVYLSNSSSIMKVSVNDGEMETIVKDMTIISGKCGYADGYIYFYANVGDILDENGDVVEEEEGEEDSTYYMYQTDKIGNIQLIGKTK